MNADQLNFERAARFIEATILWWTDNTPYDSDDEKDGLNGNAVLTTYTFVEGHKLAGLVYLLALGALSASFGDTPTEHMKNAVAYLYDAMQQAGEA